LILQSIRASCVLCCVFDWVLGDLLCTLRFETLTSFSVSLPYYFSSDELYFLRPLCYAPKLMPMCLVDMLNNLPKSCIICIHLGVKTERIISDRPKAYGTQKRIWSDSWRIRSRIRLVINEYGKGYGFTNIRPYPKIYHISRLYPDNIRQNIRQ
jgi:hypothetical protein